MSDELERVSPSEPLRQGDVLAELSEAPSCEALVVVTADCDLTHNKFGGHLTALPVVSLADYVRDYWLARELGRYRRQIEDRLLGEMVDLFELSGMDHRLPSEERLLEWPLDVGADGVGERLGLPSKSLDPLRASIQLMTDLLEATASGCVYRQWEACCGVAAPLGMARNPDRARASLVKRLSNEVPVQLPGDVLYLNRLVPGDDRGFVALARFPVQVRPDLISLTASGQLFEQSRFQRVARLASPFRYRLTQLFGEVYSAIGLPSAYEDERLAVFSELAQRLNEGIPDD